MNTTSYPFSNTLPTRFLATLIVLCLGMFCSENAFAQDAPRMVTNTDAPRTVTNMDAGWKFHFGNAADPQKDFGCGTEYFNFLTKANSIHNEGPYCSKFDDSNWKTVDLPFDFVVDLPFAPEASHSHGYKTVGYKYPETSVGWYRKTFPIRADAEGRHFEIKFDGIFRASRVWVNGFYCGGSESGYLSQAYDITDYLNYGGENLICVRADATLEEGWFYEGAGIYRHVWLTETPPLHFVDDGISVSTVFKDKDYSHAFVMMNSEIKNDSPDSLKYAKRFTLLDANGQQIFQSDRRREGDNKLLRIPPRATKNGIIYVMRINDPQFWTPETPYLYTLVMDLLDGEQVIDQKRVKFGVREVVFDKDQGMLLNGKPYKIKGVNLHQDHAGVGAGMPDGLLTWRIKQLKKFGCNAYRSSHNPMTPAMLDVCDSLGMLVIDENRLSGISEYEIKGLESMIRRDRNHPSIILWSVGNEEWGLEWDKKGEKIAATMRDYCHRFDDTREMTFATSGGPTVEVPVDVAGYNYILQNPIEEHHKNYPERKCYGSEETTGCGTRGVYYPDPEGRWMPAINREKSGRDSLYNAIERGWKFYAERPWAAGCFYWTGFDYRGEANPLSYPAVGSEFGILDYCGFPKDEAYYLKSWWTDEPTLHLLPHWNLDGHEGEKVSVWAYSNLDQIELFVNGKSLGRKTMPRNGHLEWDAIYKPGKLRAVGYKNGKKVNEEVIETTGPATQVTQTVDHEGNITVVNLSLRDKKGRIVPNACNDITVTIEGDARILGAGNGDPAFKGQERPRNNAKTFTLPAFNGYAQVILEGTATLTATINE